MRDIPGNLLFDFLSCPFSPVNDQPSILFLLRLSFPCLLVRISPDGAVGILLYTPSLKFRSVLAFTTGRSASNII